MKYFLNYIYKFNNLQNYNAVGKARLDVYRTFYEMEFLPFNIYIKCIDIKYLRRISRLVLSFFPILWSLRRIKKGDIIYVQYPVEEYFLWIISKRIKSRGGKIVYIIHDVISIRGDKLFVRNESKILNMADVLYVHTEAMQNKLIEKGVRVPMKIMHVFDYYTRDNYRQINQEQKYTIIFAGNLEKSLFIKEILYWSDNMKLRFNLYGLKPSFELGNSYRGAFKPEKTSIIEGGWGLVWDGDSVETCSGILGNYLRYNSPHKISLYLAAGIPVIVWEGSALSLWVKQKNVGITIHSLMEIEKCIDALTDTEYIGIINSVRGISSKIRNGELLKSLLAEDEDIYLKH